MQHRQRKWTHGELRDSSLVACEGQVQERGQAGNAAALRYRELLVHHTVAMRNQEESNKARSLKEDPRHEDSKGDPE